MVYGVIEPDFVGEGRRDLVDGLVEAYDRVEKQREPLWVSLEAPTGWGKSRVIREFYSRLAVERQDDGNFWPPSVLGAVDDDAAQLSVEGRRKRLAPEWLSPSEGSTPAWVWWGIGCDRRYGTPMQALAQDIGQFERLKDALARRWRSQASSTDRLRDAATGNLTRARTREAVETGAGEMLSAGLGAANLVVPGLGFVVLAAKWGVQTIRRQQSSVEGSEDPGAGRRDFGVEIGPDLAQLARKVVPVVIVIEDLHRADATLVELLSQVLGTTDTRILVVTTSWPGTVSDPNRPCAALLEQVAGSQVLRWVEAPTPGAPMGPLKNDERRLLADQILPAAPKNLIDILVDRYRNPMAMELACGSARMQRALRSGAGDPIAVAKSMPTEVRDLYRQAWAELPTPLRSLCMIAAVSTPAAISEARGSHDDRWDQEAMLEAAGEVQWLRDELDGLDIELGRVPDAYGWVRTVSEWLRQFHEPLQWDIAAEQARNELGDPSVDLAGYFEALARRLTTGTGDFDRDIHHARLLVSLEEEGFTVPADAWGQALGFLCSWLSQQIDSASQSELIHLAQRGLGLCEDLLDSPVDVFHEIGRDTGLDAFSTERRIAEVRTEFRHFLGTALLNTGRYELAATELGEVLEELISLEVSASVLRDARADLARALGEAGHYDEAIRILGSVLQEQVDDPSIERHVFLGTRHNIIRWIGKSGQKDNAVEQYRSLLVDMEVLLEPGDRRVLTTRQVFASFLREVGETAAAVELNERLLEDQLAALGPEDVTTLITRLNLGIAAGFDGQQDRAIDELSAICEDMSRVMGKEAPPTIVARSSLAYWLMGADQLSEAAMITEGVLVDQRRMFGVASPEALGSLERLARLEVRLGYAAIAADKLDEAERWLSGAQPSSQMLFDGDQNEVQRKLLAHASYGLGLTRSRSGRLEEAAEFLELATQHEQFLLERHTTTENRLDISKTWYELGVVRCRLGDLGGADAALAAALVHHEVLFGVDPSAVNRRNLANTFHEMGVVAQRQLRLSNAGEVFESAIAHNEVLVDTDASRGNRRCLANSLYLLGVVSQETSELEKAESAFRSSVSQRELLFGADGDPVARRDLANTLHQLGVVRCRLGDFERADAALAAALVHHEVLFGVDPSAVNRRNLANTSHEMGVVGHRQLRLPHAEDLFRSAVEHNELLVAADASPGNRRSLANSLRWMAVLRRDAGDISGASAFDGRADELE